MCDLFNSTKWFFGQNFRPIESRSQLGKKSFRTFLTFEVVVDANVVVVVFVVQIIIDHLKRLWSFGANGPGFRWLQMTTDDGEKKGATGLDLDATLDTYR